MRRAPFRHRISEVLIGAGRGFRHLGIVLNAELHMLHSTTRTARDEVCGLKRTIWY